MLIMMVQAFFSGAVTSKMKKGVVDLLFHTNWIPLYIIFFFRVLQDSMASTYEDEGPYPWFRTEMAIYYIVYFVVFPFFFVNIFVALVIVTFNELGEAELTDNIDKNQVSTFTSTRIINPL